MIAIPPAIHAQFAQFLIGKALPSTVRGFYTKWLRFYWDFCHKYRHDSLHSDSLPLFLKKLQDKYPSEPQRKQAQQRNHLDGLRASRRSALRPRLRLWAVDGLTGS
jgi:hypothetical protein